MFWIQTFVWYYAAMARPLTNQLTPRQAKVLEWIKHFIARERMPPTVREIGTAFGFASTRSVFDYLNALERKGYLKRGNLGARSLILCGEARSFPQARSIPIVGRVAAGAPIFAVEDELGSITVNADDVRGADVYALRVKGDSMIDAGILDGDVVLIRKQENADNGDIVVAMIDDEATLKRFHRDGTRIRLSPANAALKPISVQSERVKVLGKLIVVQRRYS